jgi:hypothetical protein
MEGHGPMAVHMTTTAQSVGRTPLPLTRQLSSGVSNDTVGKKDLIGLFNAALQA